MKKIKVDYDIDVITKSSQVQPKGCTSIRFKNAGMVEANIIDIPLEVGESIDFHDDSPYEELVKKLEVKFAQSTGTKKVVVIRKMCTIPC